MHEPGNPDTPDEPTRTTATLPTPAGDVTGYFQVRPTPFPRARARTGETLREPSGSRSDAPAATPDEDATPPGAAAADGSTPDPEAATAKAPVMPPTLPALAPATLPALAPVVPEPAPPPEDVPFPHPRRSVPGKPDTLLRRLFRRR